MSAPVLRVSTRLAAVLVLAVALCASLLLPGAASSAAPLDAPLAAREASADPTNLAPEATPSADYTAPWNSLGALSDGTGVSVGGGHDAVWGTYSGDRPATRWVQYDWPSAVTLSATEVRFWHDAGPGTGDNVAVPAGWSLDWWDDAASSWRAVTDASGFGTDDVNRTTFSPVTTTRLRMTLRAAPGAGGSSYAAVAVSEWAVTGVHSEGPVDPVDPSAPISVDPVHVPTTVGAAPSLPQRIGTTGVDGLRSEVGVTWGAVAPSSYAQVGSFEVSGTTAGGTAVPATVYVRPAGSDGGAIESLDPAAALTVAGVAPDLPPTVTAVHADGTRDSRHGVTWRSIAPTEYAAPGLVDVTGTVVGTALVAELLLVVDSPAPDPGDDTTAPVVGVELDPERPANGWFTGPVLVTVAATDAVDAQPRVETSLDGTTWTESSGPVTVAADGRNVLRVRAKDAAGNTSDVTEVPIGIDTTAPTVTAQSSLGVANATITLTGADATSGVARVQYALGSQFDATYTGPIVVTRTDEDQVLRFTSTDAAGNRSAEQRVTVPAREREQASAPGDTVPPVLTLGEPSGAVGSHGWFVGPVTLRAAAVDDAAGARVERSVGSAWQPLPSEGAVVASDGRWVVAFRAIDGSGNVSAVQQREVRLDTTAPSVTARVKRRGGTVRLKALDATSGVALVQVKVGNRSWRTYRGAVRAPKGAVVRYRAVDQAGLVSPVGRIRMPRR